MRLDAVAQAWLARQCEVIPGAIRGVVVLAPSAGDSPVPVAGWPAGRETDAELAAAATAAAVRGGVIERDPSPEDGTPAKRHHVAVPFARGSGLFGGAAVEVTGGSHIEPGHVAELLACGAAGLESVPRDGGPEPTVASAVELLGVALEHERFEAAATAVATALATRLGCERVAIGFARRGQTRVEALSHSARFDDRAILIRDIAAAMDEACDQDATIAVPTGEGGPLRITRAHEALAAAHGAGSVCTAPVARGGQIVGAFTFERPAGSCFDPASLAQCQAAAGLLGPLLVTARAADARTFERLRERAREMAHRLTGDGHAKLKLVAGGAALLALILTFATTTYRVTADATLEGRVQRAIVAGFDGYIAEAHARAGDLVRTGQVLGRLDERDLVLEQRKWAGRRAQLRAQFREAMADHDRSQMGIHSAKIAQADAQIELLREQLARTRLVAPFDGVVVKGDISQSLGSPVEKGAVLFEVAPLDGYRIILKVDERDIADVDAGSRGELALSALPGHVLPLTVERVTPISTSDDGRNTFRVEARLEQPSKSLRPGMEGIAKIDVGSRRLIWIWTHALVDRLRLWAWSFWP